MSLRNDLIRERLVKSLTRNGMDLDDAVKLTDQLTIRQIEELTEAIGSAYARGTFAEANAPWNKRT